MTEKINKKVSDVSENKLAKDEELKDIALKIMKTFEKTFFLVYNNNKLE